MHRSASAGRAVASAAEARSASRFRSGHRIFPGPTNRAGPSPRRSHHRATAACRRRSRISRRRPGPGSAAAPARKLAPNLVCEVAILQLWPETEAFQTPPTVAGVRSGALAGGAAERPRRRRDCVRARSGMRGSVAGRPAAAACWRSRVRRRGLQRLGLVRPRRRSASSGSRSPPARPATASKMPVFEKYHSRPPSEPTAASAFNRFRSSDKVAKFQPHMVKIRFAAGNVAIMSRSCMPSAGSAALGTKI